jgi:hypothetical protein
MFISTTNNADTLRAISCAPHNSKHNPEILATEDYTNKSAAASGEMNTASDHKSALPPIWCTADTFYRTSGSTGINTSTNELDKRQPCPSTSQGMSSYVVTSL